MWEARPYVLTGSTPSYGLAPIPGRNASRRDLAHLYHYYLHGAQGNTFT